MVRYPKGALPEPMPALRVEGEEPFGAVDILLDSGRQAGEQELFEQRAPLLLVGVGAMAPAALEAGRALAAEGAAVQVVSPRWAVPVPDALVELALGARGVLVVEDGLVDGGIGSQLRDAMDDRVEGGGPACAPPVVRVGVPRRFLATASREEILQECAMDAPGVLAAARRLAERCQ